MLTSQAIGYLTMIVGDEKSKDPDHKIKAIHVGYVHPSLEDEFIKSHKEHNVSLLVNIDGLPVFMNALCNDTYTVIKDGEVPKYPTTSLGVEYLKETAGIEGNKPTKAWLTRYGRIGRKK